MKCRQKMKAINEHVKKGNIAKQVNNFSRCCEEYTLAVELARKQAKKDTKRGACPLLEGLTLHLNGSHWTEVYANVGAR